MCLFVGLLYVTEGNRTSFPMCDSVAIVQDVVIHISGFLIEPTRKCFFARFIKSPKQPCHFIYFQTAKDTVRTTYNKILYRVV